MMRTAAAIAIGLAAAKLAATGASADPLSDVLGGGEGGICYIRTYSAEHLAKNPDQMTHAIQLSLTSHPRFDGAIARLAIRDEEGEVYSIGECFWSAKAGLDGSGKPYTATFKGGAGLNCTARASPNWASDDEVKEGGRFVVDLRDGKSMTIHTEAEIAAWSAFNRDAPAGFYPLGSDDRIFRVERTGEARCGELVEQLGWDYNFEE